MHQGEPFMNTHNILLESGTNELEIIEFSIDERMPDGTVYTGHYGVNVAKVLEIIRKPTITEMPETGSAAVLGAFNLRSRIIPLVDLGLWLGKDRVKTEEKVIVTEFNTVTTAFLVSAVNRIHRIGWDEVEPPDEHLTAYSLESITGTVTLDGRIIFLVDLENVVADLNPALGLKLDCESGCSNGFQYKAMVADDSAMVRSMLKGQLELADFLVETTVNGRECWDRLQEYKAAVESGERELTDILQIVISDIEMPSMDGHNLTKRIKDDPLLSKLPVILFSSLISDQTRHRGESVGADDQITKPEVGQLAQRSKDLIAQYFGEILGLPQQAAPVKEQGPQSQV